MPGFVRRFTEVPPIEVILQIEGVVVVDLAPPEPATGAGTGTVLLLGEFEDGFFATDVEANGAVEVFGSEDFRQKFGAFGFTYNGLNSQNPAARRHLLELWNGNGFLKAFKMKAQRLMIGRVDTSVGNVSFDPLACISTAGQGPFQMTNGDLFDITTDIGTASSDVLASTVATAAGAASAFATILSGDTFGIIIDGGPQTNVSFGAADTAQAAVITRINNTLGFTSAVANIAEVDLLGIVSGTDGSVQLIEVTPGVLAKIGHSVGTTAGTGNVGNINSASSIELAAIINGSAALSAIQVQGTAVDGVLRVCNDTPASVSTILVATTSGSTAVGFSPLATVVAITGHAGGAIPAGTRVRNAGGEEWVTMQTLDIDAAAVGPFVAKVRPALDDGTAVGDAAGDVNILFDAVDFAELVVTNPAALTAALTEPQMDNAYLAAMDKTLAQDGTANVANFMTISRRSDTVVREGRSNALKATECGLFARKFITGDPLGTTISQIIANVALFRSDRVFYTGKGLKVRIPGIAELGEAGGLGFTKDGIITVRPDGPLTTICAIRPPEENPGQQTNLIDDFFEVDAFGETLDIEAYKAFKSNGIAVPIRNEVAGMTFQSGVTSSLESGRKTMARRKIADFVQDTSTIVFSPYVKKLNRQARRDKARGEWEGFLAELLSEQNAEKARIEGFFVDDSENAGNTPANLARGIYFVQTTVRTLSSMDSIIVQTEIGENAVISTSP